MFKKNECYLCGGKLINGRCSLCGLDNTKLNKKNYRLNESSFDRKKKMSYSQWRQKETGETKNLEQQPNAGHLCESHNGWTSNKKETKKAKPKKTKQTGGLFQQNMQSQQSTQSQWNGQNTGNADPQMSGSTFDRQAMFNPARKTHTVSYNDQKKAKKISGYISIIIIVFVVLVSIISEMGSSLSDILDDFSSNSAPWSSEDSSTEIDYDPYQDVTRELSDVGSTYECTLGYGEYEIGAQIPEGTYEVELVSGDGSIQQDDPANSIYYYSYFGNDEDSGDYLDDVRLYSGGHLRIDTGLIVKFHSENAQVDQMVQEDNPLTEQITLKAGQTYTAGTDFPAGYYDASEAPGVDWAELNYKIYLGDLYDEEYENLNYENYGLWFYDTDGADCYRNAVFPEGTQVEVSDGDVILTPSGSVKDQNYDSFYDIYRY